MNDFYGILSCNKIKLCNVWKWKRCNQNILQSFIIIFKFYHSEALGIDINRKRIFDPTLIIFHIRSTNFYMALHLSFATFIIRACLLALTKGKPTLHIWATLLVVLYSYIIIYECVRIFVSCFYYKKLGWNNIM